MPRPTHILSTLVILSTLALPGSARAQDASPKVNVTLQSVDRVVSDLKLLSDLTSPKEKKQWKNIKEIIDTFLFGIDTTKPLDFAVILDGVDERYHLVLPIKNLKTFIKDNLEGFGFDSRKIGTGLYRLRDQGKNAGYMRYQKGYATIDDNRNQVKAIYNAQRKTAGLLARKHSLEAAITNKPGGQAARRAAFAPLRNNLLAALKLRKGETTEHLALRRTILEFELAEIERFLTESESLSVGVGTDPKTKQANLDIDLAALPGTELAKTIEELSRTPSHFANVPPAKTPILSLRVHHPLDKQRRGSLQLVLAATQKSIQRDISQTASVTDAQKTASTKALETVVGIVQTTVAQGHLDAFIQVSPVAGGGNVMVAGIRTVNGAQLRAALAAIPGSTVPTDVKLDAERSGDVTIHEVTVPARFKADFAILFGSSKTFLIGTSPDAAWCAAGPGALKALTAAITARAKLPAAKSDPVFVNLSIEVEPWIKILHRRMGKQGEVADRKLAIEAFVPGKATVDLQLRRDGNRVVGSTMLGTGILRFLGKKMAQISEENF